MENCITGGIRLANIVTTSRRLSFLGRNATRNAVRERGYICRCNKKDSVNFLVGKAGFVRTVHSRSEQADFGTVHYSGLRLKRPAVQQKYLLSGSYRVDDLSH